MDDIRPRSVADPYADLIARLPPHRRLGFVARLANGYYEGWRPSRAEVEDLVALELGHLSSEQYKARGQQRSLGFEPRAITPREQSDDRKRR